MPREATSKRVARIAARILATKDEPAANEWWLSWRDIQAVAASCLTQFEDGTPHGKVMAASARGKTSRRKRRARAK